MVVQRHLKFIDRLLKDKEELNAKCSQLTLQIQETEKQCLQRLEQQDKEHSKTLKRHKDAWAVAERVRRDNWMEGQTKVIKVHACFPLENCSFNRWHFYRI